MCFMTIGRDSACREPVTSDGGAHTLSQSGACMDTSANESVTEWSPIRYKPYHGRAVLAFKLEVRVGTRLACYFIYFRWSLICKVDG